MKIKFHLKRTIVVEFTIKVIGLNPKKDLGKGWSFVRKVNGAKENDGITAFKNTILKAAALPKDQGYELLFATGIAGGATDIKGEDRIKVLAKSNLADPDLLWSLYKEEGQKTLEYLYDTYGVIWMESLRRVLCNQFGSLFSLFLYRENDGSWDWSYRLLDFDRDAVFPALVLGK